MTLLLLLCLTSLIGCSFLNKQVVLHPIERCDIFDIKKGTKIISIDGKDTIVVEKDGKFLSDLYLAEVVKIKIENKCK